MYGLYKFIKFLIMDGCGDKVRTLTQACDLFNVKYLNREAVS